MKAVSNLTTTQSQIITNGLKFWIEPSLAASYSYAGPTVFDLTPNRYACTLSPGVGFNTANRVPGFSFTGQADYAYIDTGQTLAFSSFTLSAWIRLTTLPSTYNYTIFSKENTAGIYNYKMYVSSFSGINLEIQDADNNIYTVFGGGGSSPGTNIYSHVVATYNASTGFAQIITNGNRSTNQSLNITGNILVGDNCWIGCSANTSINPPNPLDPFDGIISQCLIYDRALTLNEVRTIYRSQTAKYRPYN